jgi:hypothetical protein
MCQWDFQVDEPVPAAPAHSSIAHLVDILPRRAGAGDSLRVLAWDYGVSHESIRRALAGRDPATHPAANLAGIGGGHVPTSHHSGSPTSPAALAP